LDSAKTGEAWVILSSGIYRKVPLNVTEILQSALNIENKSRSNPLSWKGQFSPQLVQVLLKRYAEHNMTLFDPFLGSGTVLLEAGRVEIAASGTEINPAAVVLSRIYQFINMPREKRRIYLNEVQILLRETFPRSLPLFSSLGHTSETRTPAAIKQAFATLLPSVEERLSSELLETLVALLDFHKSGLSVEKIFATWKQLSQLVIELPYSPRPIHIYHADARQTPLSTSSVDLVITSPPYINVFNYHQQYRASMESLNWDLLRIAKSEIGSNRKHRGNRFLTVIQYCLDLSQVFYELARVCRPDARLIFVVGRESMVRGARIFNGEIVAEIAYRALGYDLHLRQERMFVNRFGQDIFEDILHFYPPVDNLNGEFLVVARDIALEVLGSTLGFAPDKSKEDIREAMAKAEGVKPSPIFALPEILQPV
jgi:hypothetical protein